MLNDRRTLPRRGRRRRRACPARCRRRSRPRARPGRPSRRRREREPGEEAALGVVHRAPSGMYARARRASPRTFAVDRARCDELLLDPASADVLLEETLSERAGALVGVLLRRHESREISAGAAAQPSRSPGKNVFEVVPACATTSGARLHKLGGESSSKPSSRYATSSTIGKPCRRASSTSSAASLGGERHPGRVLVIGDRVEEFRAKPAREPALQLVDLEAGFVDRHRDDLRLEAAECHDRAEVRRRLDHDGVAAIEKVLPRSSSASIAPLVNISSSSSAAALLRLDPPGDRVERPCESRVGAYWNAVISRWPRTPQQRAVRSRGKVTGSGKPPANEISPGRRGTRAPARFRRRRRRACGLRTAIPTRRRHRHVRHFRRCAGAASPRRAPSASQRRADRHGEVEREPAPSAPLVRARERVVRVRQRERVGDHLAASRPSRRARRTGRTAAPAERRSPA